MGRDKLRVAMVEAGIVNPRRWREHAMGKRSPAVRPRKRRPGERGTPIRLLYGERTPDSHLVGELTTETSGLVMRVVLLFTGLVEMSVGVNLVAMRVLVLVLHMGVVMGDVRVLVRLAAVFVGKFVCPCGLVGVFGHGAPSGLTLLVDRLAPDLGLAKDATLKVSQPRDVTMLSVHAIELPEVGALRQDPDRDDVAIASHGLDSHVQVGKLTHQPLHGGAHGGGTVDLAGSCSEEGARACSTNVKR